MEGYIDNIIVIVSIPILIYIWVKSRKVIKEIKERHKRFEELFKTI